MNTCTFLAHDLSLIRIDGQSQLVCSRCDDPWAQTLLDHRNTPKRLQAINLQVSNPALDEALKSMEQMFGELQKEFLEK
jgi:hypothetical protein